MKRLQGLSWLALLWVLTGCAAQPSRRGAQWYGRNGSGTTQQAVEVDFEEPTPRRAEELRQSGVQLPRFSRGAADPRAHRDFVDVPESHVDLGLTNAQPLNASIYPDRDTALDDLEAVGAGRARYAYYRGAGGALIVPTLFSPATTPRIARTMLEVREHLSETVQRELKVMLLTLTGTKILQGVFSRVVRASPGPELQPTQSAPRPARPVPEPAPEPPAPAPTPTALPPSPGLVRALAGNNPTPPVAPGPRLPQDVAVSPKLPAELPPNRTIGSSPTQNAQAQADLRYLRTMGATNIRVNQQQITVHNGQRVGINRPDLQFDYRGRRYHVEYDTPSSDRGPGHQRRSTSNDPSVETILLIVP